MSSWTDFRDNVFGFITNPLDIHGEDVLTVSHNTSPAIPLGEDKRSVADPLTLFSILRDFNGSTITSQVSSDIKTGHVGSFRRLEHRQVRTDMRNTLYPMFAPFTTNIFIEAVKATGVVPANDADIVFMSDEIWYNFTNYANNDVKKYYAEDFNDLLDFYGGEGYNAGNRPWTDPATATHPHIDQADIDSKPNFYIRYYLISDGTKTIAGLGEIYKTRLLKIPKNDPAVPLSVWFQDPFKKPFTHLDEQYADITEVPIAERKPIYPLVPFKLNDRFLRVQAKDTLEYDIYRRSKLMDSFNSRDYKLLSDSLSDEYDEPEPVASEYATVAEFNTAHADWVTDRDSKVEADAQTRHVYKSYSCNLLRDTQTNAELVYKHLEYYTANYTSVRFSTQGTGWDDNSKEGNPSGGSKDPIYDDFGFIYTCGFWTGQSVLTTKDDGSPLVIVDPTTKAIVSGTTGATGLDSRYAFNYSKATISTVRKQFTPPNGIMRDLADGEYCTDVSYFDIPTLKEVIITLKDGEFPPINNTQWHKDNSRFAGVKSPLRISFYKGTANGYEVIRIHEATHWVYVSKEGQTKGGAGLLSDFFVNGKSTTGAYTLPLIPSVVSSCRFSLRYRAYQDCLHIVYSYAVITNLEWYKSSTFVLLVKIAIFVVTALTAGAGAGVESMLKQYILNLIVTAAFKYALSKLPDSTFAQILAVVLAIVVTVISQDVSMLNNASAVEIALLVTTIASKFTNVVLEEMSAEEAESSQDEMDAYQEWERNFNKLTEAEALDDDTSATVREAMKLMLFEDASDAIDRSLNLDTIDRSYDMMMEQVFDLDHITY